VVTGSKTSTTPPELLTESYLQQVYANPMTFELIVFQVSSASGNHCTGYLISYKSAYT
jgi:hypothetical protein